MKSIEESIDTLTKAIMTEATEDTENLVAEVQAKADAIRQRGAAQAEEIRKEILLKARQESERLRGQSVANARLKARSQQFLKREALLNEVFSRAAEQLGSLQDRPDYAAICRNWVVEAVERINTPIVKLHLDPRTAHVLGDEAIAQIAQEKKVEIRMDTPLTDGLGVRAESLDGRLQFDNTAAKRLELMQNTLRSAVFNLLSGETI